MNRDVFWAPVAGPGLEHCNLIGDGETTVADGSVLGLKDGKPFRLRYTIRLDAAWRVLDLALGCEGVGSWHLTGDGAGSWRAGGDQPLAELDGCIDIDISATPFTNTIAIRRLELGPGEADEIRVAHIDVPAMTMQAVPPRYTCLDVSPDGGRYRFEALSRGFAAELPVDGDGLVIDYPETFRRVWTGDVG